MKLVGSDAHTAYVYLPGHQTVPGIASRTFTLHDVVFQYKGPTVHLDFSDDGELIGIEILVSSTEERTLA